MAKFRSGFGLAPIKHQKHKGSSINILQRQISTIQAENRPEEGNAFPRLFSGRHMRTRTANTERRHAAALRQTSTRAELAASPTPLLEGTSFFVFEVTDLVNLLMIAIASAELGSTEPATKHPTKQVRLTAERHGENVVKGEEVNKISLFQSESFHSDGLNGGGRLGIFVSLNVRVRRSTMAQTRFSFAFHTFWNLE
jgi:hypothetical protein